jgi:putative ABC transport system permease protein
MLRNFFKTAGRNILKYKAYSLINFIGLTCGIALALLIIVYVRSELSYDRFHEKADRLYRMSYGVPNGLNLALTPPPMAPKLKEFFPDVEETCRIYNRNVSVSRPEEKEAFEESNLLFVDSSFQKMFTLEFVKGNPRHTLSEKFTVLINEEIAKKYFGDKDPVGESLIFSGRHPFKVAGVVKNFPEQSHMRFSMLVPYDDMFDLETEQTEQLLRRNLDINFVISHSYTYVLLKPGTDPAKIDAGMADFMKKQVEGRFQIGQKFTLMAVPDIHVQSTLMGEPSTTNSLSNIYIFMGIGVLTLIIACINYINLSTAQSFTRIKEIGIRKILGSMRYQLISQFLAESFLFVLVSMLIGYVVFDLSLPLLNEVTDKTLGFADVVDGKLMLGSILLLVVITLLAGGYPAYFVTRFESISALKGAGLSGQGNQFLRKSLVVFQLTIACMLLSGSLLIMKQIDFLNTRPLGFQREQVINVPLFSQSLNSIFQQNDSVYQSRLQNFRHAVETRAGVTQTTLSSGVPGLGITYRNTIPEGFTAEDNLFVAGMSVDYDFLQAYEMKMAAGRAFSRDYESDPIDGFIVNETAVTEFHWGTPEEAIGKTITHEGKKGKVVGVIKDFNFASLTSAVSGLVLGLDPESFSVLSIRFNNPNAQEVIKQISADWSAIFPEKAFEYRFLDEQLNEQYNNYRDFGTIIQTFAVIAILIACLGVYGLVLFTVQRKVKEIGVRKVMGASIGNVLVLIYRDFALLILIGFVLAVPVSYYLLNQWLANFIYHTSIDVLTYGLSFLFILIVVSLTISYQAIRAARANPVTSLRSE